MSSLSPKYNYTFMINVRVRKGSDRETKLIEVSEYYGVDIGIDLFDKMLSSHWKVKEYDTKKQLEKAQLIQKAQEIDNELKTRGV